MPRAKNRVHKTSRDVLDGPAIAALERAFESGRSVRLQTMRQLVTQAVREGLARCGFDPETNELLGDYSVPCGVWTELQGLSRLMKDLGEDIESLKRVKDPWEASVLRHVIGTGVSLGFAAGRLVVRKWINELESGRKHRTAGQRGHAKTHGSTSEKTIRWRQYQRAVDDMRKERPAEPRPWICEAVAREFKVNPRTIRNHTTW